MKKYDSYKDSGIEYLDKIPVHWQELRMRFIGYLYGGLSGKSANDFNQLTNEDNKCFIPFTNIANNFRIDSESLQTVVIAENEKQNKVKKGDLFFLMSSENYDDVGKSAVLLDDLEETYLNSFCKGFRITKENIVPKFLNYQLHSKQLRHNLLTGANGFTRINLKIDKVIDLLTALPPIAEQTSIANFLDLKTSEIDEIIADKKRLLELYEEEKTAIINQAVTKGIDPDAPMKDSGIEWLGEIPEHWEVKKIKHLLKKKKGALKTGPFGSQLKNSDLDSSGEFKVYTQRNVLDNDFIVGDDKINEVKFQTLKEFLIEEGDILFTSRGTIGVCNVFPADSEPGILHPCLIRIQIDRNRLNQDWIINYVNNSSLFIDNVKYESNATTIEVIYGGTLKETALPVPPIQEQQSIVHHFESECSKIDFKKARTEELIELLTEYRTALISEAVTGKIKVTED